MTRSGAGPDAPLARVTGIALALALSFVGGMTTLKGRPPSEATPSENEVRALWVTRASLTSARAIAEMVRAAREHGFNTILVQVRGRGDAYFTGGGEPRAAELAHASASFDPLAVVIETARAAGLRVHAWVNVNLVASAVELPADRSHILYRHPDWLMVPRELAPQLAFFEPNNPAYAGAISRWTRGQAGAVEGLYASPIIPASADHVVAIVTDLARRYDLDGLHLDYVRYPNETFDYSRSAIAEFRSDIAPTLRDAERRAIDDRAVVDMFAWPDALQDEWRQFRRARLSALVMRIRTAVKSARRSIQLSAAVVPDAGEAATIRLQDWRAWMDGRLLDAVCPMAYTQDAALFTAQIAAARAAAGVSAVWAGIGAYRLTPAQTLDHIAAARRAGAAGVALFSYDSLIVPPAPADYLATVGRGAFGLAAVGGGTR
ncbi:MAG: glycoside hydrolase family 10 protein [Vicinamibacterales bacterium]